MEIILYIIVFLLLVVILGVVFAKLNHIELGKKPEEMSDESLAKYIALRPFFLPAELVYKLLNKNKRG